MWDSENFLHEKVGTVSGRSANRGNHSLEKRAHLGGNIRESKERKLTLAKYIYIYMAESLLGVLGAPMNTYYRGGVKIGGVCHHHLTRWQLE